MPPVKFVKSAPLFLVLIPSNVFAQEDTEVQCQPFPPIPNMEKSNKKREIEDQRRRFEQQKRRQEQAVKRKQDRLIQETKRLRRQNALLRNQPKLKTDTSRRDVSLFTGFSSLYTVQNHISNPRFLSGAQLGFRIPYLKHSYVQIAGKAQYAVEHEESLLENDMDVSFYANTKLLLLNKRIDITPYFTSFVLGSTKKRNLTAVYGGKASFTHRFSAFSFGVGAAVGRYIADFTTYATGQSIQGVSIERQNPSFAYGAFARLEAKLPFSTQIWLEPSMRFVDLLVPKNTDRELLKRKENSFALAGGFNAQFTKEFSASLSANWNGMAPISKVDSKNIQPWELDSSSLELGLSFIL